MADFTNFELQIFTKIKELQQLKREEIQRSAAAFIYNPIIKKCDEEIAETQKMCQHGIIKDGKCQICGKRMEGNE